MDRPHGDLVSVVVIARDEARHLLGCLRSIAAQSHRRLDVVVVDDGSTDATMAIAERVAAEDHRFRVLRLTGAGRSAARNEGVGAAAGDLLCFVDGDDALPEHAIAELLGALRDSGSQVAAGAVHRLDERGVRPLVTLPVRSQTTLGKVPQLLAPATLAGRLWRRDAWDAAAVAFDERLEVFEDLPVVTAALAGASIETLEAPVYLHRRHGRRADATPVLDVDPAVTLASPPIDVSQAPQTAGDGGATDHAAVPASRPDPRAPAPPPNAATARAGRAQRRLEPAVLGALVAATDAALETLGSAGLRPHARRAAAAALLSGEPAATLGVFDLASPSWRAAFGAAASGWLATLGPRDLDDRPALERTAWALLRDERHEALAMVLRAERTGQAPPVVRRWRRRHSGWAALDRLPGQATRLDADDPAARVAVVLEELHAHGGVLELGGHARIAGTAAARASLRLVPRGGPPGLRLPSSPVLLRTAASETPGDFGTTLSPAVIREGSAWTAQTWDLWAEVVGGRERRHTDRFAMAPGAHGTRFLPAGDTALVRTTARHDGRLTVDVETHWACARRQRTALGGLLVLSGDVRLGGSEPAFELRRRSDGHRRRQPLRVDRGRLPHAFEATIPLHDLAEAPKPLGAVAGDPADAQHVWEAWVLDGDAEHRVALPADVPVAAWFVGDRVISLLPTASGDAVLVEQDRVRLPMPAAPRVAERLVDLA